MELVLGEDEKTTKSRVDTLSKLVENLVKAMVDAKFKDSGRDPSHGGSGAGDDNPWAAGHLNYTKQMEIEASDPERASQLKSAAGVR